jgi:hypothetical protein
MSSSLCFNSKQNVTTSPTKILSIDVGIKNLSFCLFVKKPESDHYEIEKWNTIDLTEQEIVLCQEIDNKNKKNVCGKEAKFSKHGTCFCLKHSKKSQFILPDPELKRTKLKNYNITELQKIVSKYQIEIYSLPLNHSKKNNTSKKSTTTTQQPPVLATPKQPHSKKDIISSIELFLDDTCLNPIEKQNCHKFNMITFGKNINKIFNRLFSDDDDISTITHVGIETQMTSKMRILSFMLAQYFIVKNDKIVVEMVSPCYKLKDLELIKTDYSTRKKNSVKHCLEFILGVPHLNKWESFFNTHKKKDDLSDAFLQGRWFIADIEKRI